MYIIREPCDVSGLSHSGIRHIVAHRITQLRLSAEEVLPDMGKFVVVQPGDAVGELEEQAHCNLFTSPFDDTVYGDPDFEPSFEWLEHHTVEACYEIAFILAGDFFVAVFVPDDPGIDHQLLSYCRGYS
jgi:hypothetical protein